MITITTAAISGLIGAIAGGGIALISQILARKWQKEDLEIQAKKELYSELSGIGSRYVGFEIFEKINSNAAKALLICGEQLRPKIIQYIASIEKTNLNILGKNPEERRKIVETTTIENTKLQKEMLVFMRKELKIKS